MNFNSELIRLTDNIYFLKFKSEYDAAMCFLRYQEYYESTEPQFYRKSFTILDFMNWYSKNKSYHNVFTYPNDWAGFNIPSYVLDHLECSIADFNMYDKFMYDIRNKIKTELINENKEEKFYLIGCSDLHDLIVKHELAHGLYYTNKEYFNAMQKLNDSIPLKIKNHLTSILSGMMYNQSVIMDEIQAYLSTGLTDEMEVYGIKTYCKKYESVFKSFTKNIKGY